MTRSSPSLLSASIGRIGAEAGWEDTGARF